MCTLELDVRKLELDVHRLELVTFQVCWGKEK